MIALFVIGSEEITNGMNIIGSHIDAPRLDLKPIPYEEQELAFFKTTTMEESRSTSGQLSPKHMVFW